MLCGACQSILLAAKTCEPGAWVGDQPVLFDFGELEDGWAGSHHIEPGRFLDAFNATCYICCTIYRDCNDDLRRNARWIRTFYQLRLLPAKKPGCSEKDQYELEFTGEVLERHQHSEKPQVFECKGIFKILPRNEVQAPGQILKLTNDTFTGVCERQIRNWLNKCHNSHSLCKEDWRTKRSFPRRLLNVGRDKARVFLEDTTSRRQYLRYATLSHCWQAGVTTKLTKETAMQLTRGWLLSDFPKRFQDAVSIARWMKVNHLWIDALCIDQDSPADWLKESTRVGDIYANSYCNIAATSAEPDKGCFTQRHVEMVEPYAIANPKSEQISQTHVIGYDDFWSNSLLDTVLHTRGWVYQERLLSPRTIHFGQEQMFWECRCDLACEAYPEGIPEQFRNWRTHAWRQSDEMLKSANMASIAASRQQSVLQMISLYVLRLWTVAPMESLTSPTSAYTIWSKTIERYMECKLSYDKDKLVAISGIAQKVAKLTGERYLAGLWDNAQLAQSLLWFVLGRKQADSAPSLRSPKYRSPSWSWASVEAKIVWNWPATCDRVLVDIVDTRIQELADSNMSNVTSAEMDVRCHLHEVTVLVADEGEQGELVEDGSYALQLDFKQSSNAEPDTQTPPPSMIEPTIHLDVPMLPISSMMVHLLPVCTKWKGRSGSSKFEVVGLLVRRNDNTRVNGTYERIGIFGLDESQVDVLYGPRAEFLGGIFDALHDSKRSLITLV